MQLVLRLPHYCFNFFLLLSTLSLPHYHRSESCPALEIYAALPKTKFSILHHPTSNFISPNRGIILLHPRSTQMVTVTVWGPFQWPLGVGGEGNFAESLRRKGLEQDSICCDAGGGAAQQSKAMHLGCPATPPSLPLFLLSP